MLETLTSFLWQYKAIVLFYLAIIIFLLLHRKRIDTQGKIILLYRTKWGLQWMEKCSQKLREWIILLGYLGVGVGFIGMAIISVILITNLYNLIIHPAATSGVSLVLPGINVPGLGVLPFWYWLISVFLIAVVHEFSHGLVARAHKIPVKNTGIVFFGPIIGAFVEPDEKKLVKEKDIHQYSILAAGSFSNILLAMVALLLLNFIFMPLQQTMVEPVGFTFDSYVEGEYPFAKAGIIPGTVITGINGQKAKDFVEFNEEFSCINPGEEVTLMTKKNVLTEEKSYTLAL